jgi:hypothetical protein
MLYIESPGIDLAKECNIMVRKIAMPADDRSVYCTKGSFPIRLVMLVLAIIFLALAGWGCAVAPAGPYDAYYSGPYYSYPSYYYTPGYYYSGPYYPGPYYRGHSRPYYRGHSGPGRGQYHHSGRGRRR